MAHAKGTALVASVRFLRKQRMEAMRVLPGYCHKYLNERVLESIWYPEEDLLELIRAVAALLPMDGESALQMVGRGSVMAHKEGSYRSLHEAADITALPRRVIALWGTQHDTGEMRMILNAPPAEPGGLLVLKDFAAPSREMCTVLLGYLAESLLNIGVKEPHVDKSACVLDGHPQCEWIFRYEK